MHRHILSCTTIARPNPPTECRTNICCQAEHEHTLDLGLLISIHLRKCIGHHVSYTCGCTSSLHCTVVALRFATYCSLFVALSLSSALFVSLFCALCLLLDNLFLHSSQLDEHNLPAAWELDPTVPTRVVLNSRKRWCTYTGSSVSV